MDLCLRPGKQRQILFGMRQAKARKPWRMDLRLRRAEYWEILCPVRETSNLN